MIASLPDDAWLALGVAGIRDSLRGASLPVDLSWLRTVAVYAGGTSPLTLKAAIIAATSNRTASERSSAGSRRSSRAR